MAALTGKPLLVNFWATWCPPCVEELPLIDAFWRQNQTNGFQVVGLAIDQPSAVRRFLQRQALGFPLGLAGLGGTELAKSLGNSSGGLPFSVFFNADGTIWRKKLGQLSPDDLAQWRTLAA
jgi:thiol-disulfide isomerase/thioredoxin